MEQQQGSKVEKRNDVGIENEALLGGGKRERIAWIRLWMRSDEGKEGGRVCWKVW
jgi:hypothetical protein